MFSINISRMVWGFLFFVIYFRIFEIFQKKKHFVFIVANQITFKEILSCKSMFFIDQFQMV